MRILWLAILTTAVLSAADLPRRGMIGLIVAPQDGNAVVVTGLVEGGAGAAAGFQKGDVIVSIDGAPATEVPAFTRAVSRHFGGESVHVTVKRGPSELMLMPTLKPRPLETSPYAEVIYETLDVRGARRRAIVTRPHKEGRLPAMILMQGLGCYSIDNLNRTDAGYGRLIGEFEQRGFVTMRVEKTGEGDSEGIDCSDLRATPDVEAAGYLAAIKALKQYPYVNPSKIYVFAHSMGPLVGSTILGQEPLAGFIAVETVGTTWFEYDLERLRVQADLTGKTPAEVDEELRQWSVCSFRFYIEKAAPASLSGISGCEALTSPFGGAAYTYLQSIADINLGENWAKADLPVLVVYGTASPVTTSHQNKYLAETINRMHPGRATYAEVPGMGHDLDMYKSQKDYQENSRNGNHPFNTGLFDVIFPWIAAHS